MKIPVSMLVNEFDRAQSVMDLIEQSVPGLMEHSQ